MLRNFLITPFRVFKRNKIYSLINIIGLSVGIVVCLVIYNYVSFEVSYDKYHRFSDRIYRISRNPFATLAPSFTYLLKKEYSNIEEIVRIFRLGNSQISIEEDKYVEENVVFAEANIFKVFDIKLLKGNPETALAEPQKLILSESLSKIYFKNIDPIGQQIILDNEYLFQVTGIFQDFPKNTHFHMDIILSYESLRGLFGEGSDDYFWGTNNYSDNVTYTYFRTNKDAEIKNILSTIPAMIDRHLDDRDDKSEGRPPSDYIHLDIMSMGDIHLLSHKMGEAESNGNILYIRLFSIVGFFILLIASINFINLNTARATQRAKEIGLKKIIGADRRLLIYQFVSETFFYIIISSVVAYIITAAIAPFLNQSLDITFTINPLSNITALITIITIILLTTLLAGLYPAIFLSAFQPIAVIKNEITKGKKASLFRNILVIFQFAISIGLIISVIVVYRQMIFIKNADLGFKKENIILLPISDEIKDNWNSAKINLEKQTDVISATISKRSPGSELLDAPGFSIKTKDELIENEFTMPHNRVGFDFFKTYGIELVAGRAFDINYSTDSLEAFVINEAAVKRLGLTDPKTAVGLETTVSGRKGNIIGVVKNFNYESLRNEIIPIITYIRPGEANTITIKLSEGNVSQKIENVKNFFNQNFPSYSFDYRFLDEKISKLYQNEERLLSVFRYFASITILIAMIGLFGLSIFNAESRTKEIGIRKVNGASILDIISLLSKKFTLWIILAFVIASPVAYMFMNKWLGNFAFKVKIPWWAFLITLIIILVIAFFSIFYQTLKAAIKNPVESLRYE
jgi:putative ABC transport system permease protein